MAKKRRKSASRSGGSTLFGILIGLILGLIAAVAVALFVTRAPMPFADKASREPAKTLLPDVRDAPDPNIGLRGSSSPVPPPGTEAPASPSRPAPPDDSTTELDQLIANLAQTAEPAEPTEPEKQPAPRNEQPAARTTSYYLQAGAFRSTTDAESMRARIIMLGLPVQIEQARLDGSTINRVRVGPFNGIDAMNQARTRLGNEKIESSVVRP